ncbi:hypothetical protein GWI33_005968 [Rhynchophorus ferrugineus]|uniref:Uncharacterized protein n=1 Tax=Rhynchophorus ferrugineus TaxID=354439 RepID=A0A834IWT0_RHYFE|nr:hypothetical protein GWI33_005968 [Rhynchophorus ferrugineus]
MPQRCAPTLPWRRPRELACRTPSFGPSARLPPPFRRPAHSKLCYFIASFPSPPVLDLIRTRAPWEYARSKVHRQCDGKNNYFDILMPPFAAERKIL